MIGYRNLNLMFLLYYFTWDTVYSKHRKQSQEIRQGMDGSEFMKSVVGGSKINSRPDFLMFTAPSKLCDGQCSDEKLVMGFPVYLGNHAKIVYRATYITNMDKKTPQKPKNKTNQPKAKTAKPNKNLTPPQPKAPKFRSSTTSTHPPMFYDEDTKPPRTKKNRLNKKIDNNQDCSCPYLDPNICYKTRIPVMREQPQEIFVNDIKKLFTVYRKTKEI